MLIFTSIIALMHWYIGSRLLPDLPVGTLGWSLGVALLVLSTLLIPLGMMGRFLALPQNVADRMIWIGMLDMGLFSSVLVLTFVRDVTTLFSPPPIYIANSAIATPCIALLVTLAGFVNARRVPQVIEINVPFRHLDPALAGFTIVQISDIHVGATIKKNYVRAVVDRVNALNADLIAVTGDLVDGSVAQIAEDIAPLASMKSRYGTFVVTGNHEYYSGAEEWVAEYRRIGMTVLINEHVVLKHDGAALVVAGVTDFSAHQFGESQRSDPASAMAGSPADTLKIMLAHQPRSADAVEATGVDLQLSGHTHGGQFWPWPLFVPLQQPYTAGLHRHGRMWVYTSRGTGYWGPPKRFGVPSEITRIRFMRA